MHLNLNIYIYNIHTFIHIVCQSIWINMNKYMFRLPLQSPTIGLMLISPFHISDLDHHLASTGDPPREVKRHRTNGNDGRRDHPKSQLLVPGFCHKCFWILMNSCLTRRLWLQNKIYVYIYIYIYIQIKCKYFQTLPSKQYFDHS